MRNTFLIVVAFLAVGSSLFAQQKPSPLPSAWIGQRVIPKTFAIGFTADAVMHDEEELKRHSDSPLKLMCTIEVIDENGDDIRLRNNGDTVWMKKSKVVLLQDAEDHFGKLLAAKPKDADQLALMAMVYICKSNLDQATVVIDQAIKSEPNVRNYQLLKLALMNEQKKDPKALVVLATELLKSEPDDLTALGLRCNGFLALDQYKEALKDADALLAAKPKHPQAKYARAYCLLELSQEKEGTKILEQLIEDEPDYPAPYKLLGHILLKNHDIKSANRIVAKGLEVRPNDPELLLQSAFLSLSQEHFENSITTCSRLIEAGGAVDPKAYWYRGGAYFKLGQDKKALDDITRYLDTEPSDVNAYLAGYQLNTKFEKHTAALKCLQSIERIQPKYERIQLIKAITHWNMEDEHGAAELMNKLLTSSDVQEQSYAAYFFATCSKSKYRKGKQALEKFEQISQSYDVSESADFNLMHAAAKAECGNYARASAMLKIFLIEPAHSKLDQRTIDRLKADIKLYEAKEPKRLARSER